MNIIHELTKKPWMTAQVAVDDLHDGSESALPAAKIGLRVFIAVVTVLFSLFAVAYIERMAFADWRPLPEPWLLWLNTGLLILSSVALHQASVGARLGEIDRVRAGLLVGGGLAFAFLVGQLLAWQQLTALGYFLATNPANSFFYVLTALHGVHLLGGLAAWGRTTAKLWRGVETGQLRLSVELCAVYWHFLLVLWLVLFGLLLIT